MSSPDRIDTHQHIVPPRYAQWLASLGQLAGGLPIPPWSADKALALMDAARIAKAVLSVSTPGVHLGQGPEADRVAREKAREVNEFAAQVAIDHPGRFGFFATLTLPDVEGAIAEADYALDHLKAQGVVLLANVGGQYLGDAAWAPLMDHLNRRKAVIFVHPSILPAQEVPGIPAFAADFLLDTTRAAINLVKGGTMQRCPDLKIILSHGGGFVPYAAERIARICAPDSTQATGIALLRKFYFDTALSSSPYALPSLLAFADPQRLLFGSDWPYAPKSLALSFAGQLDRFPLEGSMRAAIHRDNATRLFQR